jgi:hypothetical protein
MSVELAHGVLQGERRERQKEKEREREGLHLHLPPIEHSSWSAPEIRSPLADEEGSEFMYEVPLPSSPSSVLVPLSPSSPPHLPWSYPT